MECVHRQCPLHAYREGVGAHGSVRQCLSVDGALFQSLARKFKAHHALYYELLECDAEEKTFLEMQEFTFCFKCVSHGCSNGTKWGLKIVATESSIVEDAHIATASCMNCSTKLHSHIDTFLRQYLRFVATRSGSDADIRACWLALGVEAEMAELLVRIDLFWNGTHLCVHC